MNVDATASKIDTHNIDNNSSQFDIIWSHPMCVTDCTIYLGGNDDDDNNNIIKYKIELDIMSINDLATYI